MVLKRNKSSLVSLLALAVMIVDGFRRFGSSTEYERGIKSEKPFRDMKSERFSPVSERKKSPLVLLIALAVMVGGCGYVVRRFTKSDHGLNAIAPPPPRLLRPQAPAPADPVHVKFGFYPVGIYDLDPSRGFFKADFYIWLKYDRAIPAPEDYLDTSDSEKFIPRIERLEARNGESLNIERQDYSPEGTPEHRVWYRVRGMFYHNFDVRKYPFDEQTLEVKLENPIYPASHLQYALDRASGYSRWQSDGSSADLNPKLLDCSSGWKIERIRHVVKVNEYDTDWGLPNEPELRQYSQSTLIITLRRRSLQHLAEIVFPLIAAAFLATLVFFHSSKDISAAIWICVAMFISVVGHHRGFLTSMPDVGYFTTADYFFLSTYLYIIVCLTMVLLSDYYSRIGQERTAKRVCSRSSIILPICYLLLMSVVMSPAFNS